MNTFTIGSTKRIDFAVPYECKPAIAVKTVDGSLASVTNLSTSGFTVERWGNGETEAFWSVFK